MPRALMADGIITGMALLTLRIQVWFPMMPVGGMWKTKVSILAIPALCMTPRWAGGMWRTEASILAIPALYVTPMWAGGMCGKEL